MNPLKDILLNAYYLATLPQRRRAAVDRAARGMEPVSVLVLPPRGRHDSQRLDDADRDVRPADPLAPQRFDVVELAEAQRRIASGRNRASDGRASPSTTATPRTAVRRAAAAQGTTSVHVFRVDEPRLRKPAVSARRGRRPAACRRTRSRNSARWRRRASRSAPTIATTSTSASSRRGRDAGRNRRLEARPRTGSRTGGPLLRLSLWPAGRPVHRGVPDCVSAPATGASARRTAATTFPATTRSTCGAFTPTAKWSA